MIKFYYHPAPNPVKVALYLEETGLPYELIPIDTFHGEQHSAGFKAINPNAKTPVIIDDGVTVFDSSAILLYLAEKTGKFIPPNTPQARGPMLSWLMFVASGIGPYTGQLVHFKYYSPDPKEYAVNRYDFEAWRHWQIIDGQLAKHRYMLGDTYSFVDMAVWGWARAVPFALAENAWGKLPNLKRLMDEINPRPAAQRAEALRERHQFKLDMDAEARKNMFPGNARLPMANPVAAPDLSKAR